MLIRLRRLQRTPVPNLLIAITIRHEECPSWYMGMGTGISLGRGRGRLSWRGIKSRWSWGVGGEMDG
jgi:hypothetical protein